MIGDANCSPLIGCYRLLRNYQSVFVHGRCTDEKQSMPTFQVSQERAKSLGVNFTPLEVSLKDTVESLKEKNLF